VTLEISIKSGEDSNSTLSLVIHGVRFKRNLQKSTLALKGGGVKLRKPSILIVPEWTVSFFFPERLHYCYIDFHCSYLYSYYNSSRTSCIKCWDSAFRTEFQHFVLSFSISYWDLIKFPYFTDTAKRGVREWKEAQSQGEDRVNLRISVFGHNWPKLTLCSLLTGT
jgi:hypothetical protein